MEEQKVTITDILLEKINLLERENKRLTELLTGNGILIKFNTYNGHDGTGGKPPLFPTTTCKRASGCSCNRNC